MNMQELPPLLCTTQFNCTNKETRKFSINSINVLRLEIVKCWQHQVRSRKLMKRCSFGDIIEEISHYLCCFISTRSSHHHQNENSLATWHLLLCSTKSSITYGYVAKIHQNEFIRAAFFSQLSHSWKINIPRENCWLLGWWRAIKNETNARENEHGYIWRLFNA